MAHAKPQGSGLFLPDHSWDRLQLHPELGIVFEATKAFVDQMANTMVTAYGCSLKPIINELK